MIHGKYVEVEPVVMKYLPRGYHSFLFCGGRGIGKTYGALDFLYRIATGKVLLGNDKNVGKFLYMRRTATETESATAGTACVFKKYNMNENTLIEGKFLSKLGFGEFYDNTEEDKRLIGYAAGLSTFANLRGVDFSDVAIIMYDECIPENRNQKPLREEGELLLNMLETVNRNRALEGKQEVVLMMLCNPIDLGNPLIVKLGITEILLSMIMREEQIRSIPELGLHIEKYTNHKVSKEKKSGMVYKLGAKTNFGQKALSGDFVDNDLSVVNKNCDLREYNPYIYVAGITVFVHKTESKWHLAYKESTAKYKFTVLEREYLKQSFLWKYKTIVACRAVTYDDYQTKMAFEQIIGYKPPVL